MQESGQVPCVFFGKLTPQPLDSDFKAAGPIRLPTHRRIIWEYGQDLALYLGFSVLLNLLLAMALALLAVVVIVIFQRPPYVLTEEQGYVYWRSTEQYRLRTDIIKTYINLVTSTLLSIQPGVYDLSGLVELVDANVIETFSKHNAAKASDRALSNTRELWRVLEVKRYADPKLPDYLTLAVRGERVIYEEARSELGGTSMRTSSSIVLYLVYLQQTLPTPGNPWGLKMAGISDLSTAAAGESERVWAASFDLRQSVDAQGHPILPPRQSALPSAAKEEGVAR